MKGDFDAPMLMNPFPIQVLLPSIEKKNNIHELTTTLKEMSMSISTNKKLTAEKLISKR